MQGLQYRSGDEGHSMGVKQDVSCFLTKAKACLQAIICEVLLKIVQFCKADLIREVTAHVVVVCGKLVTEPAITWSNMHSSLRRHSLLCTLEGSQPFGGFLTFVLHNSSLFQPDLPQGNIANVEIC